MTTALRLAARRPLLSAAIVATLALGIGATTAVLCVVRAVLIDPLPMREQERLAVLWETDVARGVPFVEVSYPDYLDWKQQAEVLDGLAAMPAVNFGMALGGRDDFRQLRVRAVSASFFDVLGTAPVLGRTLATADDHARAAKVVVLSHAMWQQLFARDPSIVGRLLRLDRESYEIVGVLPAGFDYPDRTDCWIALEPSVPAEAIESRNVFWLLLVARLKHGVTLNQASGSLDGMIQRLDQQYRSRSDRRVVLQPLTDHVLGGIRRSLISLACAAVLVLLVGCANIAGLLLARAVERRKEMAVRTALGATPWRLARQVLMDALPFALAGGVFGLLIARWMLGFVASNRGLELPRPVELSIDGPAMGVAMLLATAAALFCSLGPLLDAVAARRRTLADRLRLSHGSGITPRQRRAQDFLMVSEMALAVILLGAALVLSRSFLALARSDVGFEAGSVLTLEVQPSSPKYKNIGQARLFYDRILEKVRALPGVRDAAGVFLRPLWGTVGFDAHYTLEGQSSDEARGNPFVNFEGVTPGYFRTLGIRLKAGRDFTNADDDRAQGVVIVSEAFARRAWPGAAAVGKRLQLPLSGSPFDKKWLTVVGVVADVRYREIEQARLDVYMPHLQFPAPLKHVVVRADTDPAALAPSVRSVIREVEPEQIVDDVQTLSTLVDGALRTRRVTAQIFAVLSAAALALALLGVHSMMGYSVTLLRRELAIRLALGAAPGQLRRRILGRGIKLAGAAVLPGLAAAVLIGRSVASLLYEVHPADPFSLSATALTIAVVGVAGCYVPARRASLTDPVEALRSD